MSTGASEGEPGTEPSHEERLARVARATDFPFTYVVINPLNRILLRPLASMRVSPTAVTWLSLVFALAAAWFLARRAAGDLVAGPIAMALAFVSHQFDALDGDLARYSGRESEFGGVLDSVFDRTREMAWALAIMWGSEFRPETLIPALVCMSGGQLYFYAADGPIRLMERSDRQSPSRWRFTLGPFGNNPTRIKLGLFEPYLYALPLSVALGLESYALWAFGSVFWLALTWKLIRLSAR